MTLALGLLAQAALAEKVHMAPGEGTLRTAITGVTASAVLRLSVGTCTGPFVIYHSATLRDVAGPILDRQGQGTMVNLTGDDIIMRCWS